MIKRKGLFFGFFLLLVLACCFGCSRRLRPEKLVPFDPASLTTEKMLEDYDFLCRTLEQNFAPLALAPEQRRQQLEAFQRRLREKIGALPDGDAQGFRQALIELSKETAAFEAHTGYVDGYLFQRYFGDDTFESDTQRALFYDGGVQGYYQWESQLPETAQKLKAMGRSADSPKEDPMRQLNLYRSGDIAVAAVKSFRFEGEDNDAVIQTLQQFCLDNLDASDFIIDIQNNAGGSATVWMEGFLPLWAGKCYQSQTAAAFLAGYHNLNMWDGWLDQGKGVSLYISSRADEAPGLTLSDETIEALKRCDGLVVVDNFFDCRYRENPKKQQYQGRIWILTNRLSASSADMMVRQLKGAPGVAIVGEPTAGAGGYVTAPANVDMILPNSRALFRYEPFVVLNEDGSNNAQTGGPPDFQTQPGQTAMDLCKQLIEQAKKEETP